MKLGITANMLQDKPLDKAIAYYKSAGIEMIEIGCGGYPGKSHCDPSELLASSVRLDEFNAIVKKHGLPISALSCHGNPLHPDKDTAEVFDRDFRDAVLLAEKLGVSVIIGFSGCPGDSENSRYPNWVTCPWPDDFLKILDWQWNEKLIPYWKGFVEFARDHGVNKIAFELHPGFMLYNTETALRLRDAAGPEIGVNFDPSHLIWQGMDPVACIRKLGDAIFHVHAKDTKIDAINTSVNGVLDTKHYGDEINRSWLFRSVGYGNGEQYWKDIVSNLRMAGYDYVLSIEHEDSLMDRFEGLEKAIGVLKNCIIVKGKTEMWWA